MAWLIAYDISDQRRWRRVYRRVGRVGYRLQYSLFWADITDAEARTLAEDLADLIDATQDDVRLYPLDEHDQVFCWGQRPWPDGVAHAAAKRFARCWQD